MSNTQATGVAYYDPEFSDVTITGTLTVGNSVFNAAELGALDGVTAGTVTANKAVIVDGSKNIGTFGTVTAAAVSAADITSTAASGELVGNAAGGLYFLSTAITNNVTTTTAPAGSLGLTSNATGRGIIFVSDGSKWQLAAITQA
jgi:hypothetical protein